MKKRLLFALCLTALFVGANAQETTFSYDFDNNSFDGWSGYDADGDGHTGNCTTLPYPAVSTDLTDSTLRVTIWAN